MISTASIIDHSHTALIVVDNQVGAIESTYWGVERSNPSYEKNISTLLSAFRSLGCAHIIHIQHSSINPKSPLRPHTTGFAFHASSQPREGEIIVTKSFNSAFVESDLDGLLKERDIWNIYFVGLSIDLCLGSTVRGASDMRVGEHTGVDGAVVRGDICLVGDATLAWQKHGGNYDAETIHGVHLESLRGEFARVLSTDAVLQEINGK